MKGGQKVGNQIEGIGQKIIMLATDTNDNIMNRIFGLDGQLGIDTVIAVLAVLFLFTLLSYLVFNPARELMKKRQNKIQGEMDFAAKEKEDALSLKAEYNAKLLSANAQVDEILSEGKKRALKREDDIVLEANMEAKRIKERAKKEMELEKGKMLDEFKREMVSVATFMAEKMIASSVDTAKQAQLVDEALNEMGDETWRK